MINSWEINGNYMLKEKNNNLKVNIIMKQLKKTLLTLVALLAVTTGAWADGIVCTASDLGKVLCTDGSIYENVSAATTAGKTAAAVIAYVDETNKNGLALALTDEEGYYTWDNSSPSNKGKTAPEICSALNTSKPVTGGTWKLASRDEWMQMFSANGGHEGSYTGLNTAIGNAGGTALQEYGEYWSSSESFDDAWLVYLSNGNASWTDEGKHYSRNLRACLAFDIASAASGPEVTWNAASNTGTFTMPGGNVTLEPDYYPQATVADGAVTAADADARATTDDPLVKVDDTKLTGAKKLMYFVSNSGTAPAYDAEGWTDQLPTAEGFTQQGIVYVWYYPVGTDEGVDDATATYSDGDICLQSITARIADAPTYAVTFAEGTDPNEWKADPATGVTKGQTVTVTYTGSKKVIGVKAEKKAPAVTVTWNYDDITGTGKSFTKDGVTITAGNIDFSQKNFMNGGTFTTTLGNFTKIEVSGGNCTASGEGWSGDNTKTWTGNASSVSFSGKIHGNGEGTLKFVFTIEPTN